MVIYQKESNRYEVALKNPAINDSDYNGEVEAHSTKIEYRRSQYDSDVKTKGFSVAAGKEVVRNTYVGARYGLDFIKETYDYNQSCLNITMHNAQAF